MAFRKFFTPVRVLVAVAGAALSSCATTPIKALRAEPVLYQWYDDGGPGEVNVKINLTEQRATYFRGRREIGWSFVATGKENHNTAPGSFKITEKIEDKHSNSYGWIEDDAGNVTNGDAKPSTPVPPGEHYVAAPMPYWQRLTSYGVGMHAGIIPRPGEPASHGCIRLPKPLAPMLFAVTKVGTPVTIVY
jgi:lipoprotein-anchoring transpeptidase ErfK/SrfK